MSETIDSRGDKEKVMGAFMDVAMGGIVDHVRPAGDGGPRPRIRCRCIPMATASSLIAYPLTRGKWRKTPPSCRKRGESGRVTDECGV